MKIPLLDLSLQAAPIEAELQAAIQRVVRSTGFVGGPEIPSFERAFAEYCGTSFAIGCGNGTDALEMSLRAVGVGKGDRVITVSHTFIATVEAIVNVGAEPVLVDVNPQTLVMDLVAVRAALKAYANVRAIIAVHLYGNMVPMDDLVTIAREHGCAVIEDAAQAHGARYRERRAGAWGELATFSFFPGKNLGAFGDAGAIITSDETLQQHVAKQRDHGRREKYTHDSFGRNSRLDPLQAAILSVKLPHLEGWNVARRKVAGRYAELLPSSLTRVAATPGCEPVFHQYVVQHERRDELRQALAEAGIDAGVHYPLPVHQQPAWNNEGLPALSLPVTEAAAKRVLSLPIFPELTTAQLEHIADTLKAALQS